MSEETLKKRAPIPNPLRMQSGRTVGRMLQGKRGNGSSEHTSKAQQPLNPTGDERFPLGKYHDIDHWKTLDLKGVKQYK